MFVFNVLYDLPHSLCYFVTVTKNNSAIQKETGVDSYVVVFANQLVNILLSCSYCDAERGHADDSYVLTFWAFPKSLSNTTVF